MLSAKVFHVLHPIVGGLKAKLGSVATQVAMAKRILFLFISNLICLFR